MARDIAAWLAFIASRQDTPFAWGSNDCCGFASGAVEALTGRNLPAEAGLHWSTPREAARSLSDAGGLEAVADRLLTEIHPASAMRGDLGIVAGRRRPVVVVVEGANLIGPDRNGLGRLPRSALLKAWSVG
jgi:hypothetical protein